MTAVIRGVSELPYGDTGCASTMELHEVLITAALADAGVDADQIGAILSVNPRSDPYLVHAEAVAERLGLHPEACYSVEAGGTAPVVMLAEAVAMVEAEVVDVAVVVAADAPRSGGAGRYLETLTSVGPVHPAFEASYGVTPRSLYGLMARAYLDHHHLDAEVLATVAVHDRAMAALNPTAQFRTPITAQDHADSPLVCDPLRRLDCAPVGDGGGAVVIVRHDLGGGGVHPDISLLGVGQATSHAHLSTARSLVSSDAGLAAERAFSRSGLTLDSVDVALVYDCFTIAMLMNVESLGLAKPGWAAHEFRDGTFGPGGGGPVVNSHGGLLSHGYPARAAGIGNLVEAVLQLRGAAADRQVRDCATALVHGMSGAQSGHAVAILERAA